MMERFLIDSQIMPEGELKALLEHNRIEYITDADGVRFILEDGLFKWETVCRYSQSAVLIYGLYPFKATADEGTLRLLNRINGELTRGSMILSEGCVVMRTSADLYDIYGAYEAIARAIEYSAGAIVEFWQAIRHTTELTHISHGKKERRTLRTDIISRS